MPKATLTPAADCPGEVVALQLADHLLLVDRFLRQLELDRLAEQVVVVVDVGDQPGAVLDHQVDAFVVDQAAVLDRVDAGHHRVLDGLRAVGVRRDLASGRMRLFDRGFQLFDR